MLASILLQAAPGQGSNYSFIIMMVIIFAIMWFFMIRPQQKKQKELQNFRNAIAVGSEVVTQGGIYGTVKKIDEQADVLHIEVANGVQIRVARAAVFPNIADTYQK